MQSLLGRHSPYFYALLRIVAGLLFMQHGLQKLFGLLGGTRQPLMSQMGLAGIIETFGGLGIALGVFTSPLAFLAICRMWRCECVEIIRIPLVDVHVAVRAASVRAHRSVRRLRRRRCIVARSLRNSAQAACRRCR